MNTLLNRLKKSKDEIVKTVEKRDETALKRSDDWQNSTKAKEHEIKTGMLADAYDGLNETIKQIEVYLEKEL